MVLQTDRGSFHYFKYIYTSVASILPNMFQVLVNLFSILHDPDVFPEPDVLKPERFIDGEGKATHHEHWIPFSMGNTNTVLLQEKWNEIYRAPPY